MVDDCLRNQLHDLEKFKENFLQQIVIQQNNLVELEKENESLKQNIGDPIACTHEEDIICLNRKLGEEKIREHVLTNELEERRENCHKLQTEITALRANFSKVETKSCLN